MQDFQASSSGAQYTLQKQVIAKSWDSVLLYMYTLGTLSLVFPLILPLHTSNGLFSHCYQAFLT